MKIEITGISDTNKKYLQVILASVLTFGVVATTAQLTANAIYINESVNVEKLKAVDKLVDIYFDKSIHHCGNQTAVLGNVAVLVKNGEGIPLGFYPKIIDGYDKNITEVDAKINGQHVKYNDGSFVINGEQCYSGKTASTYRSEQIIEFLKPYMSMETKMKAFAAVANLR